MLLSDLSQTGTTPKSITYVIEGFTDNHNGAARVGKSLELLLHMTSF